MPTYDYRCTDCGGFSAVRKLSERNDPCACPRCGTIGERVLFAVPMYGLLDAAEREAHAINERAAHAPQGSREYRARHGAGCSCCSGSAGKSRSLLRPDGSKSFPGRRPWQISH